MNKFDLKSSSLKQKSLLLKGFITKKKRQDISSSLPPSRVNCGDHRYTIFAMFKCRYGILSMKAKNLLKYSTRSSFAWKWIKTVFINSVIKILKLFRKKLH